jgi:hypothetical protein
MGRAAEILFPGGEKDFSAQCSDRLTGPHNPLSNIYWGGGSFRGTKWPVHEAEHSRTFSVGFKISRAVSSLPDMSSCHGT